MRLKCMQDGTQNQLILLGCLIGCSFQIIYYILKGITRDAFSKIWSSEPTQLLQLQSFYFQLPCQFIIY